MRFYGEIAFGNKKHTLIYMIDKGKLNDGE